MWLFAVCSAHAGDLAIQPADFSSDEEDTSEDALSLSTPSETSSLGSLGRQAILEEVRKTGNQAALPVCTLFHVE